MASNAIWTETVSRAPLSGGLSAVPPDAAGSGEPGGRSAEDPSATAEDGAGPETRGFPLG